MTVYLTKIHLTIFIDCSKNTVCQNIFFSLTLLIFVSPASYFGDSFCKITSIQDVSSFHLSLQFKTSRRSGLLLLAAGMQDYLFLELQNGKLQVSINTCLVGKDSICNVLSDRLKPRQPSKLLQSVFYTSFMMLLNHPEMYKAWLFMWMTDCES